MTTEQNKAIVRKFFDEFWNQRKISLADELFAANCVTHQLRSSAEAAGAPRNPESVKREVAAWLTGFPDLRFEVEQMIAEGDRVMTHCTVSGTHTGTWMGIAQTGRKINVPMLVIHRIAEGKIAEDWVMVGSLGLFQQIGLLPATQKILGQAVK